MVADASQQVSIRRRLNDNLAAGCRQIGARFVDYYDDVALPDGCMDPAMSDGNVHVDSRMSAPVAAALAAALGRPVTWQMPQGDFMDRARQTRWTARLGLTGYARRERAASTE